MALFENFPYTNIHELNLDWIVKIAKDFLEQYTHIQQLITDGETSLTNLTETGLASLQEKADALEAALQAWYDTHSEDIAKELADALADLNAWYTQHENYLDQTLADNIQEFNNRADEKTRIVIQSIPSDYTALTQRVDTLEIDNNTQNSTFKSLNNALITKYTNYAINNVTEQYYQNSTGATLAFEGLDLVDFIVLPSTRYYIGTAYGYTNACGVNFMNNDTFISSAILPTGAGLKWYAGTVITPTNCNKIRLCRQHSATATYPVCYIQSIDYIDAPVRYEDITNNYTWLDGYIRNVDDAGVDVVGLRSLILDVNPDEKYIVTGTKYYAYYVYTILNNRGNIIEFGNLDGNAAIGTFSVTIPHNGAKLVVNGMMPIGSEHIDNAMFTKGIIPARILKLNKKTFNPRMKSLKITFLGDSLTAHDTLSGSWGTEPNYTDYVSRILELIPYNNAIGGTGYRAGHNNNNAFMDVAQTINQDSDIVTIFGSWNDGTSNIGEPGSTDVATVYGAIEQTVKNVIARCPNAVIGIILPTPWQIHNYYNASTNVDLYLNAIRYVAKKYNIPVLDLFSASNLRPWDDAFRQKWYMNADGTHPSSEAHRRFIAPKIVEFVKMLKESI